MELKEVNEIYTQLINSKHQPLVKSMIKSGVRYSRLRVDWLLSDIEGRTAMDEERTLAHNAFISACDILSRNMHLSGENNHWRTQIGSDRKSIGDFACILHAVVGIHAR